MSEPLPPLRRELDIFPSNDPERPGFVLRDPFQYVDVLAFVPPALAQTLPLLDGRHTREDVTLHLTRLTGSVDVGEIVDSFVGSLSSAGFLVTPEFEERREQRQREFAQRTEREPAHAGSGYPEEPEELRAFLDEYAAAALEDPSATMPGVVASPDAITESDRVSPPDAITESDRVASPDAITESDRVSSPDAIAESDRVSSPDAITESGGVPSPDAVPPSRVITVPGGGSVSRRLSAIAAPHVSPDGGWRSYAHAYGALDGSYAERTFVILGTSHYGEPEKFGLTTKGFRTPFGVAEVDVDKVERLRRAAPDAVVMEDYCHRIEHSIEFQVVYLQRMVGPNVRILPILCGPFWEALLSGDRPESAPGVGGFLDALGRLAEDSPDLFWLLGVDLSHIGVRYGDRAPAIAETDHLQDVRRRDLERMERLSAGDAAGFFDLVHPNQDELRWCGFSPLYAFAYSRPQARPELWSYEQWNIDPQSVVSFAAMGYYE